MITIRIVTRRHMVDLRRHNVATLLTLATGRYRNWIMPVSPRLLCSLESRSIEEGGRKREERGEVVR